MQSYYYMESQVKENQKQIYQDVNNIPLTEVEATPPNGLTNDGKITSWRLMTWVKALALFKL